MKTAILNSLRRIRRATAGTLVEYTVIIAIVSIAGVLLLSRIGETTNDLLADTSTNMPQ